MLLLKTQLDYLIKVRHISLLIQEWVIGKCEFRGFFTFEGIYPELIMGEIILQSNWGQHPITQEYYYGRYSNNLALLKADKNWKGKVNIYKDDEFRAYKDWGSFAANFSDEIAFSEEYDDILASKKLSQQIKLFSLTKSDPLCYNEEINKIIKEYVNVKNNRPYR